MNRVFYISQEGSDFNSGLTELSPYKSIDKINYEKLFPGDEIRFRAGDIFSGEVYIKYSGLKESPIIVSSCGEGIKPILSGSVELTDWVKDTNNRFRTNVKIPVSQVYSNDKLLDLARIPAKGFYSVESGDKNSLTDNQHLCLDYDLTGATLRIRAVNWQYETNQITSHKNGTICFAESMMYQANPRYGYLLDNKLEFLSESGQWFWDNKNEQLFLIPLENLNPNNVKIEATIFENGITLSENVSNIQISDLHFEKYENAAILGKSDSNNISISNCLMNDINVYGICLDINSSHYHIQNNKIDNIRGRGISTLESSFNDISYNEVTSVGLSSGYGFDGVNNGIGIAVIKTEVVYKISKNTYDQLQNNQLQEDVLKKISELIDMPYPDEKFVIEALELALGHNMAHQYLSQIMPLVNSEAKAQKLESTGNRIAYNNVDKSGYAGIRLDGNNSVAEFNVIKNSLLRMNDGGALYCWAQNEDYTYNVIFRNNIILNAKGSCEATSNDLAYAYGIYTDNKCHHMLIENNTVVGTVGGILINDEAHHQKIVGNTLYDNQFGLVFSEYFMPDTLVGCVAHDNILFSKKRDQRSLFLESRIREKFIPGLLDNNLYANPYYPFPIIELTFKNDVRTFREFTLTSWKNYYDQDSSSTTIATVNHDAGGRKSHILINDTIVAKVFDIPTDLIYTDILGSILKNKIEVQPFSSFIIVQK